MVDTATATKKRLIDIAEIRHSLNMLVEPRQVFEIRALEASTQENSRYTDTLSGYFDNANGAIKALATLHRAMGIYITLQPCHPDLLDRAYNRLVKPQKGSSTSDNHIIGYRWLLIDCDPQRVSGISSTNEEHEQALDRCRSIRDTLLTEGWPAPAFCDSGNGGHLDYRIDLPTSDSDLLKRVLEGLAERFNQAEIHIDTTVFNPSRICKLYGTLACKGDDTPKRPHRSSRLIDVPDTLMCVPRELLEATAKTSVTARPTVATPSRQQEQTGDTLFWLTQWISDRHIDIVGDRRDYQGGYKWQVAQCPFCGESDNNAFLFHTSKGYGYNCSHNRCTGKGWQEFRLHHEPGAYTSKTKQQSSPAKIETQAQDAPTKEDSQALKLVIMAQEAAELFSTSKGERYARLTINGRVETLVISEKSGPFKRWLIHTYLSKTGNIPNATALSSAISVLEAEAQFGSVPQREVHIRVAYHKGKVYLDLGNDQCEVVEISAQGWEVKSDVPVEFRRPNGMLPLPRPISGGSLEDLRPFVNVADEDWILTKAWLVGAFHPTGPYPILDLNSERGSAKSTTTKVIRTLFDPSKAPLRKEPKDDQTFAIMAYNNYVVAFDNLSHISSRLSDNMCTLATGAGDAYRSLYTNDEEHIFDARRPQVFNGIEELATRGDLIDRCIILKLPEIDKTKRRDERTFWNEFNLAHPRILGALLDAVSTALKNLPHTHISEVPRMADFALWVQAAESALNTTPGAFLAAYEKNREEGIATEIEASPVGNALLTLMKDETLYDGLVSDLLAKLKNLVDENVTKHKSWPQNARALSGLLKRLAPSMRARDMYITQKRTGEGSNITISHVAKTKKECSKNDANSDSNVANSDSNVANSDSNVANFPTLLHATTQDTSLVNPSMTQNVAKNGVHSISASQEKREEREEEGVDRNMGVNLLHFATSDAEDWASLLNTYVDEQSGNEYEEWEL